MDTDRFPVVEPKHVVVQPRWKKNAFPVANHVHKQLLISVLTAI